MVFLFLCLSVASFASFASAGTWAQTGQSGFPIMDVGMNAANLSFSTELASSGSWLVSSSNLGTDWDVLLKSNDGFMDLACSSFSESAAVVSSIMGRVMYTTNGGSKWETAVEPLFGVQSLTRTRDGSKIYGGASNEKMSISGDFGATWKHFFIGNLSYGARYAAMPSKDVWYITAGMWTEAYEHFNHHFEWYFPFTSKIRLGRTRADRQSISALLGTGSTRTASSSSSSSSSDASVHARPPQGQGRGRRSLQPSDGMWGQIWKTADAGQTWTKQYSNANQFYFNGIDCCDINNCIAVAEGDKESGSIDGGSHIFMTADGGQTWTQVHYDDDDAASLMTAHSLSPTEAYAGGGDIEGGRGFDGYFFHTTDGGKTFTNTTVKAPLMFLDMTDDGTKGVATGISKASGGVTFGYQ